MAMRALHLFGRAKGRFALAALRRRLDALSRFAGAAGRDVPKPLARQKRSGANERARRNSRQHPPLAAMSPAPRRRAGWRSRIASPQARAGIVPARGQGDKAARDRDVQGRGRARAGERRRSRRGAADAPGEIARFLRDANLPATLRMGEDARLAAMPWSDDCAGDRAWRLRRP